MAHTIGIISRLCVLAGCLFAGGFGIVCFMQKPQRNFFKVAFFGVTAIFLSRLFYLILTVSRGNDNLFSVGVFGQISAYLFFSAANRSFLPGHHEKQDVSPMGFLVALPPAVVFMYIALRTGTVSAFLCEGLYILCLCTSVYFAVRVISERKKDRISASVAPFNLCVCGLVYLTAANEILQVMRAEWCTCIAFGFAVLSGFLLAVMLPLLKRGVEQWEA